MKVVPKLTIAFITVAACILTANGMRRVRRESATFRADHDRDVRVVGRAMADAAVAAWRTAGERIAIATIEQPKDHDGIVRVRWVCLPGGALPEARGIDCDAVASIPASTAVTAVGLDAQRTARRYAYAPVIVDDVRHGALEVSDSLASEAGFINRTIIDTILTALMLAAIFVGVSVLLSVWLVARPTQALVVLPPGEGSTITLGAYGQNQASGNCQDLGPHACDQLSMYRDWRFRNGGLAPAPIDVRGAESTESPKFGVEIVRDSYGVPHVYAGGPDEQTIEQRLAYAIGYAQAEERLFQMEVLRRAAEGTLSQLLGASYFEMDEVTRRDSETAGSGKPRSRRSTPPTARRSRATPPG